MMRWIKQTAEEGRREGETGQRRKGGNIGMEKREEGGGGGREKRD